MIIKKLELQGFKSFPDRTKIVFHPGITAIVGPNGTGKSNLVDAMLWVLGGHRQRTVRGDRTDDIIFNGTTKRPLLSMADVILSLGSDEAEMHISHRVFRSGESEYRLEGKTVRLKDIQDELWKHSIGEAEYFVIEQGAIGNFVTSKPSEKRTLLEEAAGTAYYKDKKKQAESKLESSSQNLIRLEDIIIEVEKAKNSLQRQASAAARYRRLRERIRELTSVHYLRKFDRLNQNRQDAAALYDSCLAKHQDILSKLKIEEKNLGGSRTALWDLEKALKEKQEKVYSLTSQAERLENEIDRETKRIEFFEESMKKAEAGREELKQEILVLELESIRSSDRLRETADASKKGLEEVEEAVASALMIKDQVAVFSREIQTYRDEHLRHFQGLTEKRNELIKTEKEFELILRQEEKLQAQSAEQQSHFEIVSERLARLEAETTGHKQAKEAREKAVSELIEKFGREQTTLENLQSQIAALKEKRDEASYELQALRKVEEKERSALSTENLPGSFGLLADLIRADSENAHLFDIFWKEEAKARIIPPEEFLKSFHPELKGNYLLIPGGPAEEIPSAVLNDPDVVGLLKNRIKTEESFRNFLPRLDEAVIVGNTAAAIRLWLRFPQLNFITTTGDLLLSSGLLKLGEKSEGMITLVHEIRGLDDKVASLENEIAPLIATLEERTREKTVLESRLQEENSGLLHEERSLQDGLKEQKFGRLEMEKLQTMLGILTGELKAFFQEKSSMSQTIEALRTEVAAAEREERSSSEHIEASRRNLAQVQEKAAADERRLIELKAGLDLLNEKTNSHNAQIQSLAQRKSALEAKIASLDEEKNKDESEKTGLKNHVQSLLEKARDSEAERLRGEKSLEELETNLVNLKKEQDELERKLLVSREEDESAKSDLVKAEIRKAEIERDLINLEETCWQELKKSPFELKAEAQAQPPSVEEAEGRADEAESAAEPDEELGPGEEASEAPADSLPKSRRSFKRLTPVADLSDEAMEKELEESREILQRFKAVNLMAEEEFIEQKKRYDFLIRQRQDLRESIDTTQEAIRKIDEESKVQFLKALEEVNKNFDEIFAILFKGGHAEVKLQEPDNPLESGLEIVAQPPGKRVQNLALLSGGEKSLTSMAFMFALFRYKPSPFCFLDEVDAALDDVNLTRFLDLMKAIKHQTQFIIITHNYKTMEVADYIYGTTMEDPNITKLYSVKIEKKEEYKAAP